MSRKVSFFVDFIRDGKVVEVEIDATVIGSGAFDDLYEVELTAKDIATEKSFELTPAEMADLETEAIERADDRD